MKKFIIITILFILLIPGTIISQDEPKIGTYSSQFLLESPSIRSNGMGQVGVSLVDEYSAYSNPGSLGLYYLKDEISITPWTGSNDIGFGITYKHLSFSIPIISKQLSNGSSIGLSGVLSSNKKISPEYIDTDYNRLPTERIFQYEIFDYNISLGFGYTGPIEIGAGFSLKKLGDKDYNSSYEWSYIAYDFGLISRIPLGNYFKLSSSDKYKSIVLPSIGFSYSDIDSKIYLDDVSYPYLKTFRTGFAVTLGIARLSSYGGWELVTFLPAVEVEKTENIKHITKYGIELGIVEAIYIRKGKRDKEDLSTSSWGFTLNSGGIFKLFNAISSNDSNKQSKTLDFLANRLTFQYSEAHYDKETVSNTEPFRGISIKYKLSRIN